MVVEPNFLARVISATFVQPDAEMQKLVRRARGPMPCFMFVADMGLKLFFEVQVMLLGWWCLLHVGSCCWMKSTAQSLLLILVPGRCMPCLANVCGGHTCAGLAKRYVGNARFAKGPKIPPRSHLDCWSPFQYLPGALDLTLWTESLGCPLVVPWGTILCLLL